MTDGAIILQKSLGLYIHVPFCKQKCLYCDFCSLGGGSDEIKERYVESLIRSIKAKSADARDHKIDTIYIGGGTPTVLDARELCRIVEACFGSYSVTDNAEISCECNPATASEDYFRRIRSAGVNRLSIGMQSSRSDELMALGRIHCYEDFVATYKNARRAGFENISADVMYGIPKQTMESLRLTLERLCDLAPEHISAYCLKVERGTPFGQMGDALVLPDDDEQYEMYMLCSEYLWARGYEKYEISNFARDGYESRHNLKYWNRDEYIGFGASAHSYFGGERYSISPNVSLFSSGEFAEQSRERIDNDGALCEYVMLGMRLARGVKFSDMREKFGIEFMQRFPNMRGFERSGHVIIDEEGCRFTDRGFFVSNYILSEILDF